MKFVVVIKMMKKLIYNCRLIIVLCLLSSCSDYNMHNNSITIFAGDSHVNRWRLNYYFQDLQTVNLALSGSKMLDIDNQLNISGYTIGGELIILSGINNIQQNTTPTVIDEINSQLKYLLDKYTTKYKEILVIAVFTTSKDFNLRSSEFNKLVPLVNEKNRSLINNYSNVHFVDPKVILCDKDNYLKSEYTIDGIHLNEFGYDQLSQLIRQYLR